LLRVVWADPKNMPEHLALWALEHFGPRASSAVEELRRSDPHADAGELDAIVIAHHTRVAVAEGALVGGPLIVLTPVAWCAALLAQAQMAFELAALAGYDANDQMRAADLLVLQGAHRSIPDARAALARVTVDAGVRRGKRLPRGTRVSVIMRMAYLLGILGPGEKQQSRLRVIAGYVFVGAVFVVGFALPLIWVPYMAVWMRKSTLQMGARATELYGKRASDDVGVTVRRRQSVRVGLAGGFLRMAFLIVLPVALAVIALVTDLELGSGRWISAAVVLVAASFLVTSAWVTYRWWRRRHAAASRRRVSSDPAHVRGTGRRR